MSDAPKATASSDPSSSSDHASSQPPARLTRQEVDHVATLARIDLTEEEAESFADQLSDVLEVARALEALDTSEVEPTAHPFPLVNVLRDDEVRPCLDRAEVLSAAPDVEQDRFKVPPALGEP